MKKLLTLALMLSVALSLAACGGQAGTPPSGGLSPSQEASVPPAEGGGQQEGLTTVEAGKLTVATSPDFAPYEFYALDESGTPHLAGFDMDLAQYIADYLGLTLEVIPMDFNGTIMELSAGRVDLGMAGYSPDPDRADKMDFSDVYMTGGQSFVCLQRDREKFSALSDTNSADLTIGAQTGSIQAKLAREYAPDADLIELSKVTDIVAELLTGKLDGAYIETMAAEVFVQNYPDLCLALEVPYDAAGSVVGVCKGNEALLAGVNAAIAQCRESGTLDAYVAEAVRQAQESGEF